MKSFLPILLLAHTAISCTMDDSTQIPSNTSHPAHHFPTPNAQYNNAVYTILNNTISDQNGKYINRLVQTIPTIARENTDMPMKEGYRYFAGMIQNARFCAQTEIQERLNQLDQNNENVQRIKALLTATQELEKSSWILRAAIEINVTMHPELE